MPLTKTTGGYIITPKPLIRTMFTSHTTALEKPVSPAALSAINTIQETPWRVNEWLLDVLSEAWDNGHPAIRESLLEGIKESERAWVTTSASGQMGLPPIARMDDVAWAAMGAEEKKVRTTSLRERHSVKNTLEGRQNALLDKLMVAHEMRAYERFYYPHALDFRGRCYPIPVSGPHPQGDDVAKSLIMFAEGLSLGPDGEFWLYVRAANCFGMDKLTLEDRVAWTLENGERIIDTGLSPFRDLWWTLAAEPWGFLATCRELEAMWNMTNTQDFISHLPIAMDGSCNGLQHLSAMGLDPVGAVATNLAPGPRQDIYQRVADHCQERVGMDAASGVPEALHWDQKVTRSVVKRAVMTTPYGVTDSGIRTPGSAQRLLRIT